MEEFYLKDEVSRTRLIRHALLVACAPAILAGMLLYCDPVRELAYGLLLEDDTVDHPALFLSVATEQMPSIDSNGNKAMPAKNLSGKKKAQEPAVN